MSDFSTERYLTIAVNKLNEYASNEDDQARIKFISYFFDKIKVNCHEININDSLECWIDIVEFFFGNVGALRKDDFIVNCTSFIYVVNKELMIIGKGVEKNKGFDYEYRNFIEEINNDKDVFERVVELNKKYNDLYKYKLLEERAKSVYLKELDKRFDESLGKMEDRVVNVEESANSSSEKLELIKNDLGFTSLFSGFHNYSEKIEKNLYWTGKEVLLYKIVLLALPLLAGIYAISGGEEYRVYGSFFVLALGVGLLLRMAARKNDQFEQTLSQINLKTSIAVFHEEQMRKIKDSERQHANEKFIEFIYSDIKTSEWHYPDLTSGLAELIKAVKSKN
ncbi:hypothetical protein [Vreelandella nigrificans]|uniref:Uncharacterized protein n=1 Tax=Vreelandella nigrificans TaxID=2042704 RepID=A0A2A4HR92_9GAMM|nr:hypothetical protein [Halomonas nigrificans]PCF96919.1 hypothetical protein CPA45_04205 [Halomonas nigrificans]